MGVPGAASRLSAQGQEPLLGLQGDPAFGVAGVGREGVVPAATYGALIRQRDVGREGQLGQMFAPGARHLGHDHHGGEQGQAQHGGRRSSDLQRGTPWCPDRPRSSPALRRGADCGCVDPRTEELEGRGPIRRRTGRGSPPTSRRPRSAYPPPMGDAIDAANAPTAKAFHRAADAARFGRGRQGGAALPQDGSTPRGGPRHRDRRADGRRLRAGEGVHRHAAVRGGDPAGLPGPRGPGRRGQHHGLPGARASEPRRSGARSCSTSTSAATTGSTRGTWWIGARLTSSAATCSTSRAPPRTSWPGPRSCASAGPPSSPPTTSSGRTTPPTRSRSRRCWSTTKTT